MNKIFRSIWSDALGTFIAVAENVSAQGRGGGKRFRLRLLVTSLVLTLSICSGFAMGSDLPTGGNIVAGSGSIVGNGSHMTVTQNTDKMIADWRSFSIGENHSVTFVQPGRDAAALNRVLGDQVSDIRGALNANGQVFLINPNGIVFGPTAQVDVGGLVASTLNISNDDFLNGTYRFSGDSSNAIINQGNITAQNGGTIALIAARIDNSGTLTANSGNVLMGAGSTVLLDLGGPVKIEVEQAAIDALIEQGGAIKADGGLVYLTAAAAGDLVSTVINHTGTIEAQTLATGENGEIYLMGGMATGTVKVAGTLDASAPDGGNGGFIETSAAKVDIASDASITTQAPLGKTGLWLIDPQDYTIAASGGDITGATLGTNLASNNITIQSANGGTAGNGDIFVNDTVTWNTNTLTLSAYRNIEINQEMTATSGGGLALEFNQGDGGGYYTVNAPVNLPSDGSFSTKAGSAGIIVPYTIITELGAEGSTTGSDLQGIKGTLNGNYVLGADIDASVTSGWNVGDHDGDAGTADEAKGFAPIGDDTTNFFAGRFDGLGHTISDLTINRPATNLIGLFGYVRGTAIRNIGLEGGSVTGNDDVGGLVGLNGSLSGVSNSYATGSVTGNDHVGGLVGYNRDSTISNSYATGNVTGNSDVGGLVGRNEGMASTVSNSYATGNVKGDSSVGGLVGLNAGMATTVSNSYATGNVTGDSSFGGLVGLNGIESTVSNSYFDTETTGQTGGIGDDNNSQGENVIGLSTAEALDQANYNGFDFTNDWFMIDGSTRPFLRMEHSTTIRNAHQLQLMAMDLTADYTLAKDIDLSSAFTNKADMWATDTTKDPVDIGTGWNPIGNNTNKFTGTFDGDNLTISDLYIKRNTNVDYNIGLFGYTDAPAAIKNVGLVGVNITGYRYVGGLVGVNKGDITNAHTTGSVTATSQDVGGLVGSNEGAIANAYSSATVTGNGSGGLVGTNDSEHTIENSYAIGSVTGTSYIGGFVATNYGTISNSYATGSVSGTNFIGGFAGRDFSDGAITNSYYDNKKFTGANNISGVTGKSTEEMSYGGTFKDGTWDIVADSSIASATPVIEYDDVNSKYVWAIAPISLNYNLGEKSSTYNGATQNISTFYNDSTTIFGIDYGFIDLSKYKFQIVSVDVTGFKNAAVYDTIKLVNDSDSFATFNATGNTDGKLTITKADVTLTDIAADNKTYDGTTTATINAGTIAGTVNDETLSISGAGVFDSATAGTGKTISVADVTTLTQENGSGNWSNYNLTTTGSLTTSADIAKANATVTANSDTSTYSGLAQSVSGFTATGLVNGETVDVLSVSTAGGSGTNAGSYVHTANGTATNYNLSFVGGALTITPAPLTVSTTPVSKVYDGTTSANGSATITSGSLFADDSISGGSFAFTDPNVSRDGSGNVLSDKTVTVSSITVNDGNSGNNYDISYVNNTISTIAARPITVTADAKSKTAGQSDPTLTYAAELQSDNRGLVTGETLSGALTRAAGESSGNYEIQQGTVTDDNNPNYAINYVAANMTIAAPTPPVDPDPVVPGPVTPDPVVPDPVTPDPVVPDPVVPDPVTPDPVVPDPVVPDPVTPDPVTPDPVVPDPVVPDPVVPDPVVPDPVVPDPVVPDPVTPDPVVPDPVTPDPVVPDPVTPDPVTADPVTPDPVGPDPVTPDPVTPDPVTPDPVDEQRDTAISQVIHLAEQVSAGQGSPTLNTYVPAVSLSQGLTSGTSTLGGLELVNVSSQGGNGQLGADNRGGRDGSRGVEEHIDHLASTGVSAIQRVYVIDGGINTGNTDELEEL